MNEDRLSLPLQSQGVNEMADAIKFYLLENVVYQWRQPSPRELVAELDREIGVVARWDLVSVVESLSEDREVTTRAMRAYLKSLLADEALIRALRGEYAPDEEAISTIDDLLRQSALYRSSKAYSEMVDFMSRFRDYAPYNLMLVRVQNPSCSFFATASHWRRRFRRSVKEDARPMLILAPMQPVMAVYALDDTEGGELPEELKQYSMFEGSWEASWLERLIQNALRHLIRVDFRPLSSTNAGFVRQEAGNGHEKFRIVIHEELTEKSRFGVLCHEMAHVFLGHLGSDGDGWWPARSHLGRRAIEIEAETTAYIVTRRLGLEGTSAAYISRHFGLDGTVPSGVSFDTIAKVAGKIERMATGLAKRPKPKVALAISGGGEPGTSSAREDKLLEGNGSDVY